MCGIAGIVSNKPRLREINKMITALSHRGNSSGFYNDQFCTLGHRRLSIIDLSEEASQPMQSVCGRYIIVLNGEIYNYIELRDELFNQGVSLKTQSDTEVLLYSYILWGRDCLNKIRGMFAFVIWDTYKNKLFAARDQLGVKPFYWSRTGKGFAFGSEIKGLLASELVPRVLNKQGLYQFLSYYSINPPITIIKNIFSLLPGHHLEYDQESVKITKYWSVADVKTNKYLTDINEIRSRVNETLSEAVKLQMRSDVSVGAFLSGGLDSSTIVGLMSSLTTKPVETFSIGFGHEGKYLDELSLAEKVVNKFGCNNHKLVIEGDYFYSQWRNFISSIDQPSGDGINSYLVSQATAKHVTVALSGLGGDEIFLGYRYFQDLSKMASFKHHPLMKRLLPSFAHLYQKSSVFRAFAWKYRLNFLKFFPSDDEDLYFKSRRLFGSDNILNLLCYKSELIEQFEYGLNNIFENEKDYLNAFSKMELLWYTPGTLLRDADATSMAHTLEVRVPFLDKNLVELLLSLPSSCKLDSKLKKNKPLLVDSFPGLLPEELLSVPKKGFEMPVGYWLVKHFEKELKALGCANWINSGYIKMLIDSLRRDPKNYIKVWSLLILKEWLELNKVEGLEEDTLYTPWTGDRGSTSEPIVFN